MKKSWIALLVVLIVVFVGCKEKPDEIIPPPVIVLAIPVPEVVEYDGNMIFKYEVVYAEYVIINDKRYDELKGEIPFPNLKSNTDITIVAVGKEVETSQKVTVGVLVPSAPSIIVKAPVEAIPYGDPATISWKTEGIFSSVSVDKVTQTSNSFTTPALYKSTEYTITITGPGGIATQKVLIPVGDWTTSRLGLLTYKPWMLKSMKYTQNDKSWFLDLDLEQLTNVYYYSVDKKMTGFHSNGIEYTNCDWSFLGDNQIIIGSTYTIITLTKDLFVRTEIAAPDENNPTILEITLFRP